MNRIREVRFQSNLTQKELAEKTGISYASIRAYEAGVRDPKIETWQKLADFFDVSIDYMRGKEDMVTSETLIGFVTSAYNEDHENIKFAIDEYAKTLDIDMSVMKSIPEKEVSEEDFVKLKNTISTIISPIMQNIEKSLKQFSIVDKSGLYVMDNYKNYGISSTIIETVIAIENELLVAKNSDFTYNNTFPVKETFPEYNELNALVETFDSHVNGVDSVEDYTNKNIENKFSYIRRSVETAIYGQVIQEKLQQTLHQIKSRAGL